MKVKMRIAGFLLMLLSVSNAYGQGLIPGIKFGVNSGSIQSDQIESKSRLGLEAGISFTARMGDQLDLLTELSYSQKGAIAQGRPPAATASAPEDYNLFINSFTWGVMANYYLKAPYISLQAGPVLGYNRIPAGSLNNEVVFGDAENNQENINSFLLNEAITDGIDYGLAFGISGGSEALRVNLRYYLGLKDYLKNTDYNNLDYSLKANYLQLSATYSFLNFRYVR